MARAPLQEIEALPESDRLEGFPHPRATAQLFGHETAEGTLGDAFRSGRMHHAWLVRGPEGIGKATLAYRMARLALSPAAIRDASPGRLAVQDSPAAQQVVRLSHPGLLVLRRPYDTKSKRFQTAIPIDEVRRLRAFLGLTIEPGAWRVVIVDRADDLNLNAANALLKSLEEPPVRTLFLLVTAEPGRLLATIRSRCRTLDLAPLSPENLKAAAEAAFRAAEKPPPEGDTFATLASLARGSVRRVLVLAAIGGVELGAKVDALLAGLPRVDWARAHALADELARADAEVRYELFFDMLLGRVRQLVHDATGAGETDQNHGALARRLVGEAKLASWAELWETIGREKSMAEALNLDRKALILGTIARLEAACRA